MPDLDTYMAGGSSGAMTRAAQLAALQAANAANAQRLAQSLLRRPVQQSRPEMARPEAPRMFPDLPRPQPAGQLPPNFPGDTGNNLWDVWLRNIYPGRKFATVPGKPRQADPWDYLPDGQGPPSVRGPVKPPPVDPWTFIDPQNPPADAPIEHVPEGKAPTRSPAVSKGMQIQNEEVAQKLRTTIGQMGYDLANDPLPDKAETQLAKDLISQFRKGIQTRLLSLDDLVDNPLIAATNNAATWAQYRRKMADYQSAQIKANGDTNAPKGDGTFASMLEARRYDEASRANSLSEDLGSGKSAPYVVARDEHGLLHVVTAGQWVNGKVADMIKDPRYAAQVITALAMSTSYGNDAAANNQLSRVAQDKDGNPVRAVYSKEDRDALIQLVTTAVNAQSAGDQTPVDDLLAYLAREGRGITDQNIRNGDYGGGGGGRGFGGGGGGGGGQSVRLSDPTALASTVDSIGRQRMGRSLTPAEQQAFINYVHDLERQSAAAFYRGGEYTPIDMEGQAVNWIQNQFQREAGANQYGDLASQFIALMGSANPFGMIAS